VTVPLYDDDGSPVEGTPVIPQPTGEDKRRIALQNLAKAQARNKARGTHAPKRVPLEAKQFLRRILDDGNYRKNFRQRMLLGEMAPALEVMAWHYALGKPTDKHEFVHSIGVTTINLEKLNDHQLAVMKELLLMQEAAAARQQALDIQAQLDADAEDAHDAA